MNPESRRDFLERAAKLGLAVASRSLFPNQSTSLLQSFQTEQPVRTWPIQSVDVMKYSKDVVANPPNDVFLNLQVKRAVDLGVTHVAISTPYDSLPNADALKFTKRWVDAIRTGGLGVWHRHMKRSFEGMDVPKRYHDGPLQTMSEYIINNNSTLFAAGDIFTPTPEPDDAGIKGITYCKDVCQFDGRGEFNQWIIDAQTIAKLSFAAIGLAGKVQVGLYGWSPFTVSGENNPDWQGKSFLDQAAIDACDGIIAIDSYPYSYKLQPGLIGGSMAASIDLTHQVWPNAKIVISEFGTTTAKTPAEGVAQIDEALTAAKRDYVIGFNYWHMGPGGRGEQLLNDDLTPSDSFNQLRAYYKGIK